MRTIDVYGRENPPCPYCTKAKKLLQEKGYDFAYHDIGEKAHREALFRRWPAAKTVPQIFIGHIHIGGFDDLAAADASGALKEILGDQ